MDTENSIEKNTLSNSNKVKKEITLKRILVLLVWVGLFTGLSIINSLISNIIENKDNQYGALPSLQQLENPSTQYASELYSEDGLY